MKRVAILPTLFCSLCIGANAQGAVERPPQFVVISFSNCTILERWAEFRDFVAELDKVGTHVRFTYFVTGANFIPDANRNVYQNPRQKRGYGTLEFGGANADVAHAERSPTRLTSKGTRSDRMRSVISTAVTGRRLSGPSSLVR